MNPPDDIAAALPDYEIGGELGRGGFGVVLTGTHRHLHREVAIKQLPPSLASDPKVRTRFAAEARVLAALSHPHIVPIYDYVERDGLCLLVMEKLPNGTVWSRFKERGFGIETTCAVVMAVCAGLHYAHQRGVLHRDVKPENLLFSAEGVLKITDFGIAKVVGGSETLATRGGEILGTPAYMAPEQAEGRELTAAADVYATGVMLYELLSGHLPYSEEGGALAIVYRHVYEDPVPLLEASPGVVPELAAVTMKALARPTTSRYATAEEFGVAIGEAVTAAWGPNWLSRSELQIVDPGPISESAKRPSSAGTAGTRSSQLRGSSTVIVPPPLPPAGLPGPPHAPAGASGPPSEKRTAAARQPSRHSSRVRPQRDDHVVGGAADGIELGQAELVPVRQVIELPSPPYAQAAAAAVLLMLALAVAFVGPGGSSRTRALEPGSATVAGTDPAGGRTVRIDLSKPIDVRFDQLPAAAANANRTQLGLSVAGVPLSTSTTEELSAADQGVRAAAVQANASRYLVAGELTAELRLLTDDEVVWRHQFVADPAHSPFLTLPGAVAVGFLLFLLAYVESLLRPLRRGRRQVSGVMGMVLLGAGLGAVLVGFVWLVGGPEPSKVTTVVCAALGGGAAAAAAMAAVRLGRRARIKPRRPAADRAQARIAA